MLTQKTRRYQDEIQDSVILRDSHQSSVLKDGIREALFGWTTCESSAYIMLGVK